LVGVSYFNIYHHKICLELLKIHDTVGANLADCDFLHYSGNFWWSKSSHIKKLDKCSSERYCDPEFWISKDRIGSHVSLYNSIGISHYTSNYPEELYKNTEIIPIIIAPKI